MAGTQEVNLALLAAYNAGWPAPHTYDNKMRDVYIKDLTEIVDWAIDRGKMKLVLAVGVIAKDDIYQAMYLLGFKEEPITGAEMLEEVFAK